MKVVCSVFDFADFEKITVMCSDAIDHQHNRRKIPCFVFGHARPSLFFFLLSVLLFTAANGTPVAGEPQGHTII